MDLIKCMICLTVVTNVLKIGETKILRLDILSLLVIHFNAEFIMNISVSMYSTPLVKYT